METVKQLLRRRVEARIIGTDKSYARARAIPPQEILDRRKHAMAAFRKKQDYKLLMGYYRYEINTETKYDNAAAGLDRFNLYCQPNGGNAEYLVDAANFAALEFEQQDHPNFHWEETDDGTHAHILE